MPLSSIIRQECPKCGKVAVEASKMKFGKTTLITLVCGHIIAEGQLSSLDDVYDAIANRRGQKLRPYQIEGIKFLEEANAKAILADEQGLGKTIQISSLFRLHPEILPAIVEVPTTATRQWFQELDSWCCPNGTMDERKQFLTQMIKTGKDKAMPGFKIYIISYDLLKKFDEIFEYVKDDIKTLVIDECQNIKNHLSDRAKAAERVGKKCLHRIPMSGTPIKNNAGEYFTVLNLVDERQFNNYHKFITEDCDSYHNGWGYKVGGLRDAKDFHEKTKNLIIRRTKEQVLKDLPPKDRKFYHVDLNPKLNKAYAAALKELDEIFYGEESEFNKSSATIAIMSRLRHITGISKVDECVDWTTEFVESCERKLVIFTHHTDVMDMLQMKLDEWVQAKNGSKDNPTNYSKIMRLHAGLSIDARYETIERFKNDPNARIMLIATQVGGVAINLQFCSDAVMLERQWNPPNEEQAEDRFHRFGQENSVSITYMLATGTIDEYFTELVETKRSIVVSTMDNKTIAWDQQSLMKELTQILVTTGRERWSL